MNYRKKIFFITWAFLLFFLIIGIFYKNFILNNDTNYKNDNNIVLNKNIENLRNDIKINDLIYPNNDNKKISDNILYKNLVDFNLYLKNNSNKTLINNIYWWLEKEKFDKYLKNIDEKYLRNFNLSLEIYDENNKIITQSWTIYVNNVNIWNFENWEFNKNFDWFLWLEYFNILIRSNDYNDWFITLNSLYSEWNQLYAKVYLKKANFIDIDLSKDNNLKLKNYSISVPKCTFFDENKKCITSKIRLKSTYFSWNEVNNWDFSLNMKALDSKNKIVTLYSWWMAFNEFIYNDKILTPDINSKIEITYNISPEEIKNMQLNNLSNWYWYYDKNLWLWKFLDLSWEIDLSNNTFKIKTNIIY